jgi:hypothetical protein
MHRLFNNLFMPEDSGSGGGSDESTEDTFELLNTEDEPQEEEPAEDLLDTSTPEIKDEEEDEETKEVDDELKEIEEELKGPTEEDLELTTPVRRKEILAKYPKLFKDFPYLEKAYYREQQFTEVFPTIPDAKIAADKARVMDQLDQNIMNGDISNVLAATKAENIEAFYKLADNYLPALKKVDKQAYFHVLGNVVKDTIITMIREGKALGPQGEPLTAAANILNQFVFGSQQFTPPQNLSRQQDPREQDIENRQHQEYQQRVMGAFESTRDQLQTKADNVLKSTIDQHIDPNGSMSDYVRGKAVQDAKDTLENLIGKDARFVGLLDKLWEKAFEKGFDKESTDRIKAAYLSKAKTLLPSVIKKARNDALRGSSSRSSNSEETLRQPASKKGPITPGKSTTPSSGKFKKPSDIPKGMSTLDVLMKD